jgi:hypothetical protein
MAITGSPDSSQPITDSCRFFIRVIRVIRGKAVFDFPITRSPDHSIYRFFLPPQTPFLCVPKGVDFR